MDFRLILNSILLGAGLSMDAFSVSLANGLGEPKMKLPKMCAIAGTFAVFQAAMPMIGFICVHTIVKYFTAFESIIPWIALILLCYIGGKMLFEALRGTEDSDDGEAVSKLTFKALMVQGLATSIDALSVGFTIADYKLFEAIVSALIISVVTFAICLGGLALGKRFGTKLAGKAGILGGLILILIGIEIFITGLLGI